MVYVYICFCPKFSLCRTAVYWRVCHIQIFSPYICMWGLSFLLAICHARGAGPFWPGLPTSLSHWGMGGEMMANSQPD